MHSIIEIQNLWSLGKAKSLARQRDPSKTSTVEELTRAPTLEYVIIMMSTTANSVRLGLLPALSCRFILHRFLHTLHRGHRLRDVQRVIRRPPLWQTLIL